MFGWQAKSATTNGVFQPKIPQINIVQNGQFFYNFCHRPARKNGVGVTRFYGEQF
jgi:hypothetical protein